MQFSYSTCHYTRETFVYCWPSWVKNPILKPGYIQRQFEIESFINTVTSSKPNTSNVLEGSSSRSRVKSLCIVIATKNGKVMPSGQPHSSWKAFTYWGRILVPKHSSTKRNSAKYNFKVLPHSTFMVKNSKWTKICIHTFVKQ